MDCNVYYRLINFTDMNNEIEQKEIKEISTGVFCPDCDTEMEQIDTTYSNINTSRCRNGQHTGNIYRCETCECSWLENFLNNSKLERWAG